MFFFFCFRINCLKIEFGNLVQCPVINRPLMYEEACNCYTPLPPQKCISIWCCEQDCGFNLWLKRKKRMATEPENGNQQYLQLLQQIIDLQRENNELRMQNHVRSALKKTDEWTKCNWQWMETLSRFIELIQANM